MQPDKRHFLRRVTGISAGLAAATVLALANIAAAQDIYPSKPVKLLVGFPAGSSTDVAARVLAQKLSGSLGQQFLVDNRPGASSNIAARAVASSTPDGLTLFLGTIANTISITLQPNVSVDLSKELVPVAMIGSVPNLLVVHPSLGVDTMQQLIAKAKANPGKITYASSGNGTSPHLSGELFTTMTDTRMLHVPYKGSSPAVADLLAGQVSIMFAPASTALPHIRSGKLKALATTGVARTEAAPDLPTVQELGLKDFESSVWFGLNAPLGTPPAIVEKLRAAVLAAQENADFQNQFKQQGIDIVRAGPKDYAALIGKETDKWAGVIKAAGIKTE